jgi:hypothetical protein
MKSDIEPFELIEGDEVVTRGTLAYFKKRLERPNGYGKAKE